MSKYKIVKLWQGTFPKHIRAHLKKSLFRIECPISFHLTITYETINARNCLRPSSLNETCFWTTSKTSANATKIKDIFSEIITSWNQTFLEWRLKIKVTKKEQLWKNSVLFFFKCSNNKNQDIFELNNKNEFDFTVFIYWLFYDWNYKCSITQLPIWRSCKRTIPISRIWKGPLRFSFWTLAPKAKLRDTKTILQPAQTRFCQWQSAWLWPLLAGIIFCRKTWNATVFLFF